MEMNKREGGWEERTKEGGGKRKSRTGKERMKAAEKRKKGEGIMGKK